MTASLQSQCGPADGSAISRAEALAPRQAVISGWL